MSKTTVLFFSRLIWLPYIRVNTVQLPRPDLDPRAEMGPSIDSMDWHSHLIELFWLKLCIALGVAGQPESDFWPAGLNWHFAAETDLFNIQCIVCLLSQ